MNACQIVVWYARTIWQELKKGKFYPFFRYWVDPQFRTDIKKLRKLLMGGRMPILTHDIMLGRIHFSHDINYPKWVTKLREQILAGVKLPPIKITWDGEKYIVIDGNHRLKAMRDVHLLTELVTVRELIGLSVPENERGAYPP